MYQFLFDLTLVWLAFALLFELFLKNQTTHRANRFYLIFMAVAGLAWPFLKLKIAPFFAENALPTVVLPTFQVGAAAENHTTATTSFPFLKIGWLIYWLGFTVGATSLAVGFWQLFLKLRRSQTERLTDGFLLVRTERDVLPHSFFKLIFWPKSLSINDLEARQILAHEAAHGRLGHSLDVLFFELLRIGLWFHPLAWWLKSRLRAVHEFEADGAAARLFSRKQYGVLLMQQSLVGVATRRGAAVAVANSFFSSPLKRRIIMLTRKKSSRWARLSYFLALPTALFLLIFQCKPMDDLPQSNYQKWEMRMVVDTVLTFDPATNEEKTQTVKTFGAAKTDKNSANVFYKQVDEMPEYPGGEAELWKFLQANVKYPEAARAAGAQGKVVLSFIVEKDGSLSAIDKASPFPHESLFVEGKRILELMPRWKPGFIGSKAVRTQMLLPAQFSFN